jgi:hypothetical protein
VAKIKRDFENELKLSVRITQEIPLTSSGKHRFTISDLEETT